MLLHLFRHGQTNWNLERRVQGQSESTLTKLGCQQATNLGSDIKHLDLKQVYCSSSVRTRETAAHAFTQKETQFEFRDNLREIHLGPWEGFLYAEMERSSPEDYDHFWNSPGQFDVDGAETFQQLQQRAINAVQEIYLESHSTHEQVAVVSHGALIKTLLCHYEGRDLNKMWEPPQMTNCSHSIVKLSADGKGEIIQYAGVKVQLS
ncbi:MAG: histidine phosphatase family protein [SAR86 cluster bacterium]|uniref:Histidine phosphatase family protein n=1 Tax=SAR86 cluster bacterium TaxID=2030880 RepID=A0A2A4MN82_9GAMM|nr:MAG: histidine phosphatase family protein [SAR86 cluster bacterium]